MSVPVVPEPPDITISTQESSLLEPADEGGDGYFWWEVWRGISLRGIDSEAQVAAFYGVGRPELQGPAPSGFPQGFGGQVVVHEVEEEVYAIS